MKILLGSNNKHKQEEIQQIFDREIPGQVQLLLPAEVLENNIDPEETGTTFEENSLIKAKAFHEVSGMPAIADDTGLEIDALNGQPGVYSARFAGEHGNDAANRNKALELLDGTDDNQRTARFRTVICLVDMDIVRYAVGKCEGRIIREEKGRGGFGYDSLFVPLGHSRTFAEMSADEKNAISHRNNAAMNLVKILKDVYNL